MPYSAISDAEIDPDSPVTTGLMVKMRDNPKAVWDAENGAPRNKLASLAEPMVHMFEGQNGQNTITINPFNTAPTSMMLLLVSITVSFTGESGSVEYSVRMDGTQFEFVASSTATGPVTIIKLLQQSNASHTLTIFVAGQQQNFSAECRVSVTAFAA